MLAIISLDSLKVLDLMSLCASIIKWLVMVVTQRDFIIPACRKEGESVLGFFVCACVCVSVCLSVCIHKYIDVENKIQIT